VRNTTKSGHIATGALGSFSSTAGEQASDDPSSRNLMSETGKDSTFVEDVDDDEADQDSGEDEDGLSMVRYLSAMSPP
jgi:hypothetical protein